MTIHDIKTWTISADHKATPKNPFDQWGTPHYRKESLVSFEAFASQHTYACDETLAPGDYTAENFGDPVWEFYEPIKRDGVNPEGWVPCTDNNPEFARAHNLKTRQFLPTIESPITEPKVGEIWVDGLGNEVELLDIGYDQRFPRFLCKKLKNGSECYREFNELVKRVEYLPLKQPTKEQKVPKEITERKTGLGLSNNIDPCPFCGGIEGEQVFLGRAEPDHFQITCICCSVKMKHDRKDKVIGIWNNRKPLSDFN